MKYLKLFENNEYYTTITASEFVDHDDIPFTDQEIENIRMIFNFDISRFATRENMLRLTKNGDTLAVSKAEDEWYYVNLGSFAFDDKIFYKCDQMDGLHKLIRKAARYYILRKSRDRILRRK